MIPENTDKENLLRIQAKFIFTVFIYNGKALVMQINNIPQFKYDTAFGKQYKAPKMKVGSAEEIGLDLNRVLHSKYASSLRLGELINTGTYADVYSLSGWQNSYVVRIERTESGNTFDPKKLMSSRDIENNTLYETANKMVSIRKRISGEPLHGKNWRNNISPKPKVFCETMENLAALPDEAYEKFIDDIVLIRSLGFDIDTWNPNNYLLDKKNKCINIIDIMHTKHYGENLEMKDFFSLLDYKRLSLLQFNKEGLSIEEIAAIVTKFIDRMIGIAKKKGFLLEVEQAAKEPLAQFYQDFPVLLYRRAMTVFKK